MACALYEHTQSRTAHSVSGSGIWRMPGISSTRKGSVNKRKQTGMSPQQEKLTGIMYAFVVRPIVIHAHPVARGVPLKLHHSSLHDQQAAASEERELIQPAP